jgi:hypothetical protein
MSLSSDEMRDIFNRTRIIRRPTYGIVKGYHELPYICLGPGLDGAPGCLFVRGRIHVSPQLLIKPRHYQSSYEDIFGEDEVDVEIAGRIFGFLGFPNRPVECSMEHLEVKHMPDTLDEMLSKAMDDLERMEDITTGVIITPESQYYQISIERFISFIIEDEFR